MNMRVDETESLDSVRSASRIAKAERYLTRTPCLPAMYYSGVRGSTNATPKKGNLLQKGETGDAE